MFTTGEFTKIARVTRRTLRHYREIGLFEPFDSATESGYHYYTIEQLPRLHRILALRDLGFALEQIRSMVDEAVDPGEMRGMLQLRKAEIEQSLQEEQMRIRSIESRLQLLEEGIPDYEIVIKRVAPQHYYSTRFVCTSPEHGVEVLERVARDLPAEIDQANRGLLLSRMHAEAFDPVGADVEVGYLVKDPGPLEDRAIAGMQFRAGTLPEITKAATLVMNEGPDLWHLGTTAIGHWIETNDQRITDMQREVWHTYELSNTKAPVVEFQWPVEATSGSSE